jgi:hypothetical protein
MDRLKDMSEDLFYTDLIQSYVERGRFIPRQWLADELAAKMEQPNCRYVLLTAEPGAGKTAFAAWQAQQNPDWLRYFIRRDSLALRSSGDIGSFLLALGHQLAARRPELFHPESLADIVEQHVGVIQPSGKVIGLMVQDLQVSPFYRTAKLVEQKAESVAGQMIGIVADRATLDPRLLEPLNLLHLALLDPAAALKKQQPKARLVVLVDALDELRYQGPGETLLSAMAGWPELPDNVRFVLTSRADDDLLRVFRQRQKAWLQEATIPSGSAEVQQDLNSYFSGFCAEAPLVAALKERSIDPQTFIEGARTRADGNFQYAAALTRGIQAALEDTPGEKQAAALDSLLQLKGVEKGLSPLYAFFISLVRDQVRYDKVTVIDPQSLAASDQDAWKFLYRPVMGTLAVAQTPLNPGQIKAFGGLMMETSWLTDALARLKQFLDQTEGGYRYYHATLRDFLTAEATLDEYPECHLGAAEWHRSTSNALLKACGKDWKTCTDEYALQYTPAHLLGAAGKDAQQELLPALLGRIYALAHSDDYAQAYLKRYRTPGRLLRFLQEALGAALEVDDLPEGWKLIGRYQNLLRQERDFARLSDEAHKGDLRRALERSEVYAGQPNALALIRMWVAWLAASAENTALVEAAAKQSLETLRGQMVNPELKQVDEAAAHEVRGRVEMTLSRLLARIAAKMPVEDAKVWFDTVRGSYGFLDSWMWEIEFTRGMSTWGQEYYYNASGPDAEAQLKALEEAALQLDPSQSRGENSMSWRNDLSSILAHNFAHPGWQGLVERAVKLISLDDYPSYREMSLAWLAAAVLGQPDEAKAQQALQTILSGMVSADEPELPEDTRAMMLGWRMKKKGLPTDGWALRDQLRQELANRSDSEGAKEAMGGRGRHDPWAWDIRRVNAIAGALDRREFAKEAKELLDSEAHQEKEQSFAGYRCLANLAVAMRWLELREGSGEGSKAWDSAMEARQAADNMKDEIIKQQRLDLIDEVMGWLKGAPPASTDHLQAEALTREAAALSGARRNYRLQYLSAVWRDNPKQLKALLPLALEDITSTDAILGRLLGTLASQPLLDEALDALATEVKLD